MCDWGTVESWLSFLILPDMPVNLIILWGRTVAYNQDKSFFMSAALGMSTALARPVVYTRRCTGTVKHCLNRECL